MKDLSLLFPLKIYEVPIDKKFLKKINSIKLTSYPNLSGSYFNKDQDNSLFYDVEKHLKNTLTEFSYTINKEIELSTVWVQKYNKYQYHDMHVHTPKADLSFIYYIDCTKNSGKTIFFNPGHPYITTHRIEVKPQKNRLIIFSATLPHYAEPNKDNKRLVVSGNLTFKNNPL
tara:strand:+ start:167 stop:682 length:516 start_codon:yes stop_codon:yes gene_type:complete